ncbi:PAS-domain containing protein [Aliiroseovarius sp. 2305UL8-7]|uniref:PAS-domain containing protein n=1 Tax=Aliiroseovarius conchicola TaxID=3121637 RepID=UPI0035277E00
MYQTFLSIGFVLVAFLSAFIALLALSIVETRRKKSLRLEVDAADGSVVFLFDDERLSDATDAAQQMLSAGQPGRTGTDWHQFAQLLQARFPNLTDRMSELADLGHLTLVSTDAASRIDAVWQDGLARIELRDNEGYNSTTSMDRLSFEAMKHELESLRATSSLMPLMVWREDENGAITWANKAYLDLAAKAVEPDDISTWPPQKIFNQPRLIDATDAGQMGRVAVQLPGSDQRHWFDVHSAALGDEFMFTAVPADKIVTAENSRTEFITTLTKTFAHLPIGLAIFDRKRRLTLFNPALTDLVALPIDFLVATPTLSSFLDRLREKRMIPEPKDYVSWRHQMSDLEAAAVNGTYEETWTLPTGQTYRVTGRPHPDGAVAFLFEDISAEISLTRRFRSELEMGQAALDCLDDAVVVFTAGGILSMSNAAYGVLWGNDPETTLGDSHLGDAVARWSLTCAETPVWLRLKEFVAANGDRQTWTATVPLLDGRSVDFTVKPMMRGATMVRFREQRVPTRRLNLTEPLLTADA